MFRFKLFKLILILTTIVTFFHPIGIFAFDYVINDFSFHPTPNTPRPVKGVPFNDPVFHTTITRITDGPTDLGTNYVQPGYPKHDIENADGTMLFLQSYKWPAWHFWNANPPYNFIRNLPTEITDDIDPDVRWDATDPNILYSTYSSRFYKYNVSTNQITLLHDFKADFPSKPIARVFTAEEGDSSADSRYWFFKVRCYDANHNPTWWDTADIVYDKDYYGKDNGKIVSVLNEGNPIFHQLNYSDISFDGNWLFCTEPGIIYPKDLSKVWDIPKISGHADRGISAEGRQVVFGAGHRWSNDGYTDLGTWTAMVDFETRVLTWLAPMGNGAGAYHIAVNTATKPGWGLVSVYAPTYPNVPTAWDEHTIYLVELTTRTNPPPRVWMVAQTHTVRKDYSDDIFAKMNRKGTKIWFGSGWGKSYSGGGQYDVYQIDLPSTWYKDLMGNMPPTASISANPLSGKPPLTVSFTGSGKDVDGTITSYVWNFGDGTASNQQNPSHTYQTPGSFTATLKVTDDKGAGGNANVTINVLKSDTTPPAPPKGVKIIK